MIHTSLDTWGPQAEYIRHGLEFKSFQQNVERCLSELPELSLAFMSTFNNLSVVGYRQFIDWVIDLRRR